MSILSKKVLGTLMFVGLLAGGTTVFSEGTLKNEVTSNIKTETPPTNKERSKQIARLVESPVDTSKINWWIGKYSTLKSKNYNIYTGDWKKESILSKSSKYYNKTVLIQAEYPIFDGRSYYKIQLPDGKMGYINTSALKSQVDTPWGTKISKNGYVTVTGQESVLSNLQWGWKANSGETGYYHKTFKVTGFYNKFAENNYWSLESQNQWMGYLSETATEYIDSALGVPFSTNKKIKIQRKDYYIYKDKDFNKKVSTKNYYNKNYFVKTYYNHYNNNKYYSLKDSNGKWIGYVNAIATKVNSSSTNSNNDKPNQSQNNSPSNKPTPNVWGTKYKLERYATIQSKNYDFYSNKNWKKSGKTSKYYHQTLKIDGYYKHANGNTYFSVYNNKNKWIGYVNARSLSTTTSPWGVRVTSNYYATIKNGNYDIYRGRSFKKHGKIASYKNKTLKVEGYYHHFNGAKYVSIRSKDKYIGEANEKSLNIHKYGYGKKYNYTSYYTVTNGNYTRYANQANQSAGTTSNYKHKTIRINGKYKHYNGNTYYSIYKGKTWLGYVNANAGKTSTSPWGIKLNRKQTMAIGSKNYDIYKDKEWHKRTKTSKYYKKKIKVNGYYNHYNGKQYESIYTTSNKWLGYVNADATISAGRLINKNGVYQYAMDIAVDVTRRFGGVITSGYRPGSRNELGQYDDHSRRCAIDISGVNYSTYQKMKHYIVNKYKNTGLKYVIANNTWATHSGGWVFSQYPYGAHMDHIHISIYQPK